MTFFRNLLYGVAIAGAVIQATSECGGPASKAWKVRLGFPSETAKWNCGHFGMHELVYSMSWNEEKAEESPCSLTYTIYSLNSPKNDVVKALSRIQLECPDAEFESITVTKAPD